MLSHLIEKINLLRTSERSHNLVETTYMIRFLRKISGTSVLTIEITSKCKVERKFTWLGFLLFIIWYSLYYYCLYKICVEDQSILRTVYNTRLQHYGDEAERLTVGIFMMYAMWKVPFDLSGSTKDIQLVLDIDKALQDLGQQMDYSNGLKVALIIFTSQAVIIGTRLVSVWISLFHLDTRIPVEKVFHMVFADAIVFIIAAQYCSYLLILKRRYKLLNRGLNSIRLQTTSEFFIFRVQPQTVSNSFFSVNDKYLSKKIKAYAKIYGMLYNATESANDTFGLVLLLMMILALLFVILYLYYFMEATASGLIHYPQKYIDFLSYVFWQIGYALTISLVCIYFSETTIREAQVTPQIIHQIINCNLGHSVETEAINFSLQTLHQKPTFTAYGLFKLDYVIVLEGARSVTTFLVILLQFVTDKH